MPTILEEWSHVIRKSKSDDRFDRVASLAFAVASLEIALTASGVAKKRNEGIIRRLEQIEFPIDVKLPSTDTIKAAVNVRNRAVHETIIPNQDECRGHIETLYTVWCSLRRKFVTKENAAWLGVDLIASGHIYDVYLYGTLARHKSDANDIDLLIFDDGEVSYLASAYGLFAGLSPIEAILDMAEILTEQNRAAINSGWLDCIAVNGDLFGIDKGYTRNITKLQNDPLFFLNISDGLLALDPSQPLWTKENTARFDRLASLRAELEDAGIVSSQT